MWKALFQNIIYELGIDITSPFSGCCLSRFGKELFLYTRASTYTHADKHVQKQIYIYVHIHTYMPMYINTTHTYTCTYLCTHTLTCAYLYTPIHMYTVSYTNTLHAHTYMHPDMDPYIHPSIHPCIHACMNTHTCMYVHTCMHEHTYMYVCMHTDIHIHIHTYINSWPTFSGATVCRRVRPDAAVSGWGDTLGAGESTTHRTVQGHTRGTEAGPHGARQPRRQCTRGLPHGHAQSDSWVGQVGYEHDVRHLNL